ncbi:unnamed protein product [Polarella glacialis]|uniref:Acyltransferase n=1 Tax=Polarella glacialis TaxID=89957 RepID=A0A813GL79_POLGL|nr:unnamed protein product [Polarella glacialis]CAE8650431.1 unnamed protein product [Polarella glacialis]|mmetsp:Transcript_21031/g.33603  ORF Transcript_21031/g.33603 Transcript_21031/m.33603 type:complete len:372 (+) Transcript_21031:86-1201(+)
MSQLAVLPARSAGPDLGRQLSVLGLLGESLVRPWVYWLFHSWRLFGFGFALPPLLAFRPLKTLLAIGAYIVVHRKQWWQRTIHRILGYGASRRHKIVNPAKHLTPADKRYLYCLHPHGVLADGWHSIIARNPDSFDEERATGPPEMGRKIALCFAPVIQHVPVHQEMYRNKCGAADKRAITKWWKTPDTDPALIPGGFAEAVFANAGERKYEYSYLKGRTGFMRICLEEGKDIVPCYTFRASRMYNNPGILRGVRARFSQHYFIGLVPFTGWMGTSMPLTDETTTVIFPPFEASRYQVSQLDEAHAAYLEHLKTHFDANKDQYGMPGVELVFVGNDFKDEDFVARGLRSMGMLKDEAPRAKSEATVPRSKL